MTLGRSRLDCGISFGQLVQGHDVSWIKRERKVMGRELGKRGPERRGCLIHHREPELAREVSRTQRGTEGAVSGGRPQLGPDT